MEGWTFKESGKSSSYVTSLIFLFTEKGPMNPGPNFLEGQAIFRLTVDNHTWLPGSRISSPHFTFFYYSWVLDIVSCKSLLLVRKKPIVSGTAGIAHSDIVMGRKYGF